MRANEQDKSSDGSENEENEESDQQDESLINDQQIGQYGFRQEVPNNNDNNNLLDYQNNVPTVENFNYNL